jgi:hypothetical protein
MRKPQLECALVERHRMPRLPGRRRSRRRPVPSPCSHPIRPSHLMRDDTRSVKKAARPSAHNCSDQGSNAVPPIHQRRVIQHTTTTRQRRSCGRDVGIPPQPAASFCSTMEPARRWHSAFSRHGLPTSARRRPRPVETPWLWGNQAVEACRSARRESNPWPTSTAKRAGAFRTLGSIQLPLAAEQGAGRPRQGDPEPAASPGWWLPSPAGPPGLPAGCGPSSDPDEGLSVLPCLTLQLGSSVLS